MKEEFLNYIWENKLFDKTNFKTSDNETIEVIHQGFRNSDAGPDFFNAKIKIDEQIWVGNVEIHINSSDWERHNHQNDKSYNNVILHITHKIDKICSRQNGEKLTAAILNFDNKYFENYTNLISSKKWIACEDKIKTIDNFIIQNWLNRLFVSRLEKKSDIILSLLEQNQNSWEETFYQHLAKNFGLSSNVLPFEMLTKSLPLKYLAKQKDNLLQIEAMLFGQAGMLEDEMEDEYYNKLKKEYKFLSAKYDLKPLEKHVWKFLRLRPANFPTIRIAQFAMLIYKSNKLFSKIIETNDIENIKDLFRVSTSEYWQTHYNFGTVSEFKPKHIGETTIENIIINTVVQFVFVYGKAKDNNNLINKSIEFAEKIKPEINSITKSWKETGINSKSAFESQALIHLKNEYCNYQRCTQCQIGNKLIKN